MQPSLFPPKVKGERDLWFEFIIINLGFNVETRKYSTADVEEKFLAATPHSDAGEQTD